jgi:hypothetical protein
MQGVMLQHGVAPQANVLPEKATTIPVMAARYAFSQRLTYKNQPKDCTLEYHTIQTKYIPSRDIPEIPMPKMADQSAPLLNSNQPKPAPMASGAVATLGALKFLLGAACAVAPRFSGGLFLLDVAPQAVVMTRLFGSGVAALGALTWSLNRWAGEGKVSKDELRRAVIFNLAEDVADVVSCGIGYSTGMYGVGTLGMLGGGCAGLAALGLVGVVGLSGK